MVQRSLGKKEENAYRIFKKGWIEWWPIMNGLCHSPWSYTGSNCWRLKPFYNSSILKPKSANLPKPFIRHDLWLTEEEREEVIKIDGRNLKGLMCIIQIKLWGY